MNQKNTRRGFTQNNVNVVYCPPCGESTLKGGKGGKEEITFMSPSIGTSCHFLRKGGRNSGFTLIELLVVVLIIGILAAVAVPQYQKAVEKSRATQALTLLKSISQAAQNYYLANGTWPTSFEQLDVDMPSWKGTNQWRSANITDTRSNDDWSLQLFNSRSEDKGTMGIVIGRLNGPYRGTGFLFPCITINTYLENNKFFCAEKLNRSIQFNGENGDYCHNILNGTLVRENEQIYRLDF